MGAWWGSSSRGWRGESTRACTLRLRNDSQGQADHFELAQRQSQSHRSHRVSRVNGIRGKVDAALELEKRRRGKVKRRRELKAGQSRHTAWPKCSADDGMIWCCPALKAHTRTTITITITTAIMRDAWCVMHAAIFSVASPEASTLQALPPHPLLDGWSFLNCGVQVLISHHARVIMSFIVVDLADIVA